MSIKQKFCSECGAPLEENDRFCPVCGTKVIDEDENDERKPSSKKTPHSPVPENEKRSTDDAQSKKTTTLFSEPTKETGQNDIHASTEDNNYDDIGFWVIMITAFLILWVVFVYTGH